MMYILEEKIIHSFINSFERQLSSSTRLKCLPAFIWHHATECYHDLSGITQVVSAKDENISNDVPAAFCSDLLNGLVSECGNFCQCFAHKFSNVGPFLLQMG